MECTSKFAAVTGEGGVGVRGVWWWGDGEGGGGGNFCRMFDLSSGDQCG